MSKVIPIEENMEHVVSEVICLKCLHRWISVRPRTCLLKEIHCDCGNVGYVIETCQEME